MRMLWKKFWQFLEGLVEFHTNPNAESIICRRKVAFDKILFVLVAFILAQEWFIFFFFKIQAVEDNLVKPFNPNDFFYLIKGSETFCRQYPHRKRTLLRFFEAGSLFNMQIQCGIFIWFFCIFVVSSKESRMTSLVADWSQTRLKISL